MYTKYTYTLYMCTYIHIYIHTYTQVLKNNATLRNMVQEKLGNQKSVETAHVSLRMRRALRMLQQQTSQPEGSGGNENGGNDATAGSSISHAQNVEESGQSTPSGVEASTRNCSRHPASVVVCEHGSDGRSNENDEQSVAVGSQSFRSSRRFFQGVSGHARDVSDARKRQNPDNQKRQNPDNDQPDVHCALSQQRGGQDDSRNTKAASITAGFDHVSGKTVPSASAEAVGTDGCKSAGNKDDGVHRHVGLGHSSNHGFGDSARIDTHKPSAAAPLKESVPVSDRTRSANLDASKQTADSSTHATNASHASTGEGTALVPQPQVQTCNGVPHILSELRRRALRVRHHSAGPRRDADLRDRDDGACSQGPAHVTAYSEAPQHGSTVGRGRHRSAGPRRDADRRDAVSHIRADRQEAMAGADDAGPSCHAETKIDHPADEKSGRAIRGLPLDKGERTRITVLAKMGRTQSVPVMLASRA
jgi:hypothetical protein